MFLSIVLYFLVTISAYASWFPGSTKYFAFNTTSGLVIRATVSIIFILACLVCYIALHKQINHKWTYVFLFMIIISFIMIFITQTTYKTLYRTTKLYNFMAVIDTSVSLKTNFTMFFSFAIDILFGLCFMFVVPKVIKNYKYYIILLSIFLLIMFYSCCYSFIKEKAYYIEFLKGNWQYSAETIGSIFGNKQQWGVFLAPAFVSSFIGIYLVLKSCFKLPIKVISSIVLSFVGLCVLFCSIAAFCKTAIVANIVFLSFAFFGIVVFCFCKKKKPIGFSLLGLVAVIIGIFTAVMLVPDLHKSGFGKKIYDLVQTLISRGEIGAEDRFEIMRAVLQNFPGINIMFGMPKGTLDAFTRSVVPEMVNGLHSGIAIYFGRTGIFGLIVYILLFGIVVKKMSSLVKQKPLYSFLLIAALLSSIILNLGELEILIISSSATVFIYNILCVVLPLSEERMINDED